MSNDTLNKNIALILRVSVTIAFLFTAAGYVYLLTQGSIPGPRELREFSPLKWHTRGGMAAIGILAFIAVPVTRVVYSAIHFIRTKDWLYTLLSLTVLLMVGLGVVLGLTLGHAAG